MSDSQVRRILPVSGYVPVSGDILVLQRLCPAGRAAVDAELVEGSLRQGTPSVGRAENC